MPDEVSSDIMSLKVIRMDHCRGGSRVGVQGVRTPALLIRVPFFEKNLFFQNLLFREDDAKLRTQTFVYVHTDLLTDTCFISEIDLKPK